MNKINYNITNLICLYIIFLSLVPTNFKIAGFNIKGDYLLLLVFLAYILNLILSKEARVKLFKGILNISKDSILIFMIILSVVMIISISYASDKALAISETLRFISYILLYFIIKLEIKTEARVNKLIFSYIFTSIIVSVFGIIQYFTRIGLGEEFIYNTSKYSVAIRITSTLDNSNTLGAFLLLIVFPLIMLGIYEKDKNKKTIYIIAVFLNLITIILTFSRNAWLGLLLGGFLLVIVYNWRILFIMISALGLSILIPQIRTRAMDFKLIFQDPRVKLWEIAIKMIKDHPIKGVGNGNYYTLYGAYVKKYPELDYNHHTNFPAHNSYLKIQSELGIFGIASFLGLLVSIIYKINKLTHKLKNEYFRLFYIGFFISTIVFYFMNISDNLLFVPKITSCFWIIVAISEAINYNKICIR
ncbi:O-antigen ligase [Clostridium homopropionicum DSM 5847]|uniref:O-antigen ligase n=1 Tax=Clostridium homopropionicum DSM 5847 TaxID=1121318 RepID=A0A0L6ZDQ6_9CLOT|nr:O-antigen ligase family protein [Clostridium homopropionicum]KOA21114.1 O-antigen ligase [Clostridium homopropionicum DSM 5847]SFF96940.1 O-antigen ligase [Clostridium homopropionicum]